VYRDDGGTTKYVRMNNNTLVNIGQLGLEFGPTEMLILKDNIAMNAGFMPMDTDDNLFVLSPNRASN